MNKDLGKVFDLSVRITNKHDDCIRLIKNLLMINGELVLQVADSLGLTNNSTPIVINGVTYEVSDIDVKRITALGMATSTYGAGNGKVEAIKELRALTGMGLKESKDTVEMWVAAAQLIR